MIEAVVFDMDGVLIDSERVSVECWKTAAIELGIPEAAETIYGCFGLNREDTRNYILGKMGENFPFNKFLRIVHRHNDRYLEQKGIPAKNGVVEILDFLKEKGIKIGLASSTRYERVMMHLTSHGIADYFDELITGDMVKHSKPRPDIYLKACKALDVDPALAIAVEDSPNGLCSAYAAGMHTVMVPDMVQPTAELEAMIWKKFDSLLELRDFLKENL